MTPKEKAKELFNNFYDVTEDHWNQVRVSKQCALIAVDLRLEIEYGKDSKEYWNDVKQEIENL